MTLDADLALLSRLRFVTRKRKRGGSWGERRSTRRGAGLEFADYRDYTPGDDPRRVDWNLYARLDRPYVRLHEEEEDLAVMVLLDGSASMAWGEGETARWPAVQRLAAAFGTMTLLGGDVLWGAALHTTHAFWGPSRGRGLLPGWQTWCSSVTPSGTISLTDALRDIASRAHRPGLALLLTDGYDPAGLGAGLAALAGRGHEVVLLHLLTPDELNPALRGDLRLVDAETGDKREVTVDGAALDAYQRRLADWQAELRALAGKHGGRYTLLRTDVPLRRMLLEDLRRARIVS
ncbi:MAG TPA: DUF58 domain-containing protein [Anaerolineae bacterium]|nr:DUF58 domain-containing protein [Anaerolineae bacterium]HQI83498.1 DUF58 domain-containing protein [Anaerolineae bacterium]